MGTGEGQQAARAESRLPAGYTLLSEVWEGPYLSRYQARREGDSRVVLVQTFVASTPEMRAHVEHAVEVLRRLHVEGLLQVVDVAQAGERMALVLEWPRGEPLSAIIRSARLSLADVLDVAAALMARVAELHAQGTIHRQLTPSNIWLTLEPLHLELAPPAITPVLDGMLARLYDPLVLEGALPYVAPEQTGRTAQTVDTRSDLYGVGALLYELCTGRPPFVSADPLELIHAHLARTPESAHAVSPSVPLALSSCIDKLLQKSPDRRYRTARGAWIDLVRIREAHNRGLPLEASWKLGEQDRDEMVRLPQGLYGRECERSRLMSAFEQVCNESRAGVVLLQGDAGTGKTSLAEDLRESVAVRRGYLLYGKFEERKRDVPYSAFVDVLSQLARTLLSESEERISRWRVRLTTELGVEGRLLVGLVPALAPLLSVEPHAVRAAKGAESQQYFLRSLERVLWTLASPAHPVVLVIDDVQWADIDSLSLLSRFCRHRESVPLLSVLLSRKEVTPGPHELFQNLREGPSLLCDVELGPLSPHEVQRFVADCFERGSEDVTELSRSVQDRTLGNPFYMRALLEDLVRRDAAFDLPSLRSVLSLQAQPVAELLLKPLRALAPETQSIVADAAALGSTFDAVTLSVVSGLSLARLLELLSPAFAASILVQSEGKLGFAHDRTQELVYASLPEAARKEVHLRAARRLRDAAQAKQTAWPFEIADHFNLARSLLRDPKDLLELSRANLHAGQKARAGFALSSALRYFRAGIAALDPSAWDDEHALMWALELGALECEQYCGEHKAGDARFEALLARTATPAELAQLFGLQVHMLLNRAEWTRGVELGLDGLRRLGLVFPDRPSETDAEQALLRVRRALSTIGESELLALPLCNEPRAAATIDLSGSLLNSCYVCRPDLFPLLAAHMMEMTLLHGLSEHSPEGIVWLGIAYVRTPGHEREALALAELAPKLIERRGLGRSAACRVLMMLGAFLTHWTRPLSESLSYQRRAYDAGLEVSDFLWAGYCLGGEVAVLAAMGRSLPALLDVAETNLRTLMRMQNSTWVMVEAIARFARTLMGLSPNATSLGDSELEERRFLEQLEAQQYLHAVQVHCMHKMILLYLVGDTRAALEWARRSSGARAGAVGCPSLVDLNVHASLLLVRALSELGQTGPEGEREREEQLLRAELDVYQHELSGWCDVCPESFAHLRALVAAEVSSLEGRALEAAGHYEAAIAGARRTGSLHYEALAHELAARAWEPRNTEHARLFMREAHRLWGRYGARQRTQALEQQWPQLVVAASVAPSSASEIDLVAALKVARAISEEVRLEGVVQRLLAAAVEHAGAERGVLFVEQAGEPLLQAEWSVTGEGVFHPEPLGESVFAGHVPVTVVRKALCSAQPITLADALYSSEFGHDPYVQSTRVRSVLCVPVPSERRPALLYLENSLAPHVFTPQRVELLRHVCAHAAIALENARLYEALRESEERRLLVFREAVDAILLVDAVHGRVLDFNEAAVRILSRTREEIAASTLSGLTGLGPEQIRAAMSRAEGSGQSAFDARFDTGRGDPLSVQISARKTAMRGQPVLVCVLRDVTEQKVLEQKLVQAQKLEVVGRLAAGVAHDFNNVLTCILGNVELLQMTEGPNPRLSDIGHAAERAAAVTRQLLALHRRESGEPRATRIERVIQEMGRMLHWLIREDIQLVTAVAPDVDCVLATPAQLEQILLNLVVNARDAMPQGGTLRIEVDQVRAANDGPAHVRLTVTDTGSGMDEAVRKRIFEPFFTTKAIGKGSGLGLSTVLDTVRAMRGRIEVETEVGRGTSFHVSLPVAAVPESTRPARALPPVGGRETVLVVEDETPVREFVCRALETAGYHVLEASTPDEALSLCDDRVSLLVSDMIMPGLSGAELAGRLIERHPSLRVLFVSGYVDIPLSAVDQGVVVGNRRVPLLSKPFSGDVLLRAVRARLDQGRGEAHGHAVTQN
jgi:PAS domain S-box-containing protein